MKGKINWQIKLAAVFILLAIAVYYAHFLIFRDVHHIFLYFIGDVGFVFFEVLLVTIIIHQLLHRREQKAMQEKMHMLTGAFFSEMGTELLRSLAVFDEHSHKITAAVPAIGNWSEAQFLDLQKLTEQHDPSIDPGPEALEPLRNFLLDHKSFQLDLLQNSSLLKDQPLADLVWAVFHLTKELQHRADLKNLPKSDYRFLLEDIKKVYQLLLVQWAEYMHHLRHSYPYLFSLAGRKNPFENNSVEIK